MGYDVLILGAGPAGLGAAYRAATRGFDVCVLERASLLGGLAGSFEFAGVRVDHGSHRLHPSIDPRILAELRSLLGADLERRERDGRIRLAGRWISFPLRARELATSMPRGFLARAAVDALRSPMRKPAADTFSEILLAGLGPTLCNSFYFPYARKIWGADPQRLSGVQARRRVTADSPSKILRRVIRGSGTGGASGAGTFWYPRRGYGQISEALASAATERGASIELDTEVARIEFGREGGTVATADGRTFSGRHVWSTLPVTVLARLMDPSPPAAVVRSVDTLRFRSMVLVYLALDVDRYTSFDAHYLPGSFTRVTRLSEPKNYRSSTGPHGDPADRTVVCAEIPCDRSDALWSASDAELGDLVRRGLIAAGLPDPVPVEVHVRRLPFAYPIYLSGFESHFENLDAWVESLEGLLTFGRQGLFAHDNLHHALAMAWSAVDCLTDDGGFDEDRWSAARREFAQHVVED